MSKRGLAALGIGALACAAGAFALRRLDVHVARIASGVALVYTRHAPDGAPVRVLSAGGVWQSATYLGARRFEPVFAYHRAFDAAFELAPQMWEAAGHGPRRVLALGGGGYAWPKHALTAHGEVKMDVVEIDPAVTALARRWFFVEELAARVGAVKGSCLDSPARLGLITGDARQVLEHPPARYDIIVNDCFAGAEPVEALATLEAARAARATLAPGGLYLANVVSASDGADLTFLRDVVATLSAAFAQVRVREASDALWGGEDNFLVMASDAPYHLAGAIPFDDDFCGTVLRDVRG